MKYAPLNELCTIQSGGTPSRSNTNYWKSPDIPWVKISDIKGKHITETEEYISNEGLSNSSAKIFPSGTILYTIFATLGEVGILDIDAATNQAIAGLTITSNKIKRDYLYYYLQSIKRKVANMGRGVAQNNINIGILKQLEVPLYPPDMQSAIVCKLTYVEQLISNRKQALTTLDALVKSRFVEMFGDPHHSNLYPYRIVKEFTNICSGGTPSRKIDSYWKEGTIRWVKTTELQNCVIYDTEEKITLEALEKSSAKLVPADTVLIAMYGQGKTRGMTGYLNVESTTNQACACILPSKEVNQKYLWRYFMMSYEELRGLAVGAGQPNLTGDMIKNFPVLMPPLVLQEEYVAFAELADKSKLAVQQSIDTLQTLKAKLMQDYFG